MRGLGSGSFYFNWMKSTLPLSSPLFSKDQNMKHNVLIAHHQLEVPAASAGDLGARHREMVATVLANMAYYGFAPSIQALTALNALNASRLASWWRDVEPAFKAVTGADRQMDRFVVYKNFPREVLAMSEAQYWFAQILMYIGAPNEWFTEEEAARPALNEKLSLKVLSLAGASSLSDIYASLMKASSRWTDPQQEHAEFLLQTLRPSELDLSTFGFKENGLSLMVKSESLGTRLVIADATDVLRLAAGLSGADVSLREAVKFRRFSRAQRRQLVAMLEASKNPQEDFAMRPVLWKQLLSHLHPGDFKAPRVSAAYDALYRGEARTFNAQVESKIAAADSSVLALLAQRPGEFARRLHAMWGFFGLPAVTAFVAVMDKLTTAQLLKLRGYLRTVNSRQMFIHPPRGNWSKAKFVANEKTPFSVDALMALLGKADQVLTERLKQQFPQGADVDADACMVKLPTNDQELASYGRGTVFRIPANMTFIRSASYWACARGHSTWFDNGWNFFDENWSPVGTCCWNHTHEMGGAAVFSGDPTNSKDMAGRACQMIDLYLDKLAERGVRYAVWNVLAYSHITFAQAEDVLATLQWGETATSGKLYEPARAQMVFPLKGESKTKYVAYVDVVKRELVYMDANFGGDVSSAGSNAARVAERMPAFVEYLAALPSVADLFDTVLAEGEGAVPVLYSDQERTLAQGQTAYVFQPTNAANVFKPLDLRSVA